MWASQVMTTCKPAGPIQVHTYEGTGRSNRTRRTVVTFKPKASSYDQLESAHRLKPPKPPVYRRLDTERKEAGYIELLDEAYRFRWTITKYEPCNRSGPNPVHLYEKRRDTRDQGEESGDLELKVSKYDQLHPDSQIGTSQAF